MNDRCKESKAFFVLFYFGCLCTWALHTAGKGQGHHRGDQQQASLRQPQPVEEDHVRRNFVRGMIDHAWKGYEQFAFGFDELQPFAEKGINNFGGLGATPVDSFGTLLWAGLQQHADRAAEWMRTELSFEAEQCRVSLFETNIRIVGGLLAAYDLTGQQSHLTKAADLADRLLPAFEGATNGFPCNFLCLPHAESGSSNKCGYVMLAEVGTFFIEFAALSNRTRDPRYRAASDKIFKQLQQAFPKEGLLPVRFPADAPADEMMLTHEVSVGGAADSYYEYLLKMWLLDGCSDDSWRAAWERSMDAILEELVFTTDEGRVAFLGDGTRNPNSGIMLLRRQQHLSCFLPGNLALGVMSNAVSGDKRRRYALAARALTQGCYRMYSQSPSGLGADMVFVNGNGEIQRPEWQPSHPDASMHGLRPEVIESVYYMWRMTGNPMYRDWGWQVVEGLQRHTKMEKGGYHSLQDAFEPGGTAEDMMPSFFLGETLKYLWLLYSAPHQLPLDRWVLNTEAHPIRAASPSSCRFSTMVARKRTQRSVSAD